MHVVFWFKHTDVNTHTIQERKSYPVADNKEAMQIIQSLYTKPEHGHMAGFRYGGGALVGSVNVNEVLYVETLDND